MQCDERKFIAVLRIRDPLLFDARIGYLGSGINIAHHRVFLRA
jgi:hypothetical protein